MENISNIPRIWYPRLTPLRGNFFPEIKAACLLVMWRRNWRMSAEGSSRTGTDSCRRTFKLINVWFARIIRREWRKGHNARVRDLWGPRWGGRISGRPTETNNVCLFALILLFPHYTEYVYYNRMVSVLLFCSWCGHETMKDQIDGG